MILFIYIFILGVRCERASALLRMKMETEEDVKALDIKGVYQLQGGIDKYFKDFPEGGYWKGKNYVFDKRFAHAPPLIEGLERAQKLKETLTVTTTSAAATVHGGGDTDHHTMELESITPTLPEKKKRKKDKDTNAQSSSASTTFHDPKSELEPKVVVLSSQGDRVDGIHITPTIMGKCESCHKPWDKYRGKRRCPTCGVPSLICKECYDADVEGTRLLGPSIRCDLCVAENITSKKQLAKKMDQEQEQYERKLKKSKISAKIGESRHLDSSSSVYSSARRDKNDVGDTHFSTSLTTTSRHTKSSTRLHLKNMCVKRMDQETLVQHIPNITHIQWITDRKTGQWYGSAFVEVKSLEDAEYIVNELNGKNILGRPIRIVYSPPDPKDKWPVPNTCIV